MLAVSGKTWSGFFSDKSPRQRLINGCSGRRGMKRLTANELNGDSTGLCSRYNLVNANVIAYVFWEKGVSCRSEGQKRIEVCKL